jgi:hypothetical protein
VREAALSVATRQEKLEAALLIAKEKEKMWSEKVRVLLTIWMYLVGEVTHSAYLLLSTSFRLLSISLPLSLSRSLSLDFSVSLSLTS